MIRIESAAVAGVGYDETHQTMTVKFQNGRKYQYHDVPKNVFEALTNAESSGKFVNKEVKGKYKVTSVG